MLARINPFATKQRRENIFLFLNGLSVLLTTAAKAGIAENSDTAENLLAATRIANLLSFTLPYIERMMESQLVEGRAQRITNHLYTALVFGAATATYASWSLSMRLFEIALTGAATGMKYVAKCVPKDVVVDKLLSQLERLVAGAADEPTEQKTYAEGVTDASCLIKSVLKVPSPTPLITPTRDSILQPGSPYNAVTTIAATASPAISAKATVREQKQ